MAEQVEMLKYSQERVRSFPLIGRFVDLTCEHDEDGCDEKRHKGSPDPEHEFRAAVRHFRQRCCRQNKETESAPNRCALREQSDKVTLVPRTPDQFGEVRHGSLTRLRALLSFPYCLTPVAERQDL